MVACGHELFILLCANVMLMMMLINANNFAAHQSVLKKERKYHVMKTCQCSSEARMCLWWPGKTAAGQK